MYPITILTNVLIAPGTWEMTTTKPDGYDYIAGQYTVLTLPDQGLTDTRNFRRTLSFASAPHESILRFTVRDSDSGFKQVWKNLKPGDTATVTRAVGRCTLPSDSSHIVFLAGGIGITPVYSMLLHMAHVSDMRPVTLIYTNRHRTEVAYLGQIQALALGLPNFRLACCLTQEQQLETGEHGGYVTRELLGSVGVDQNSNTWYYSIGAPRYLDGVNAVLDAMGIPKERRKQDPFTGM